MTLEQWLHFAHVVSSIVWVGGGMMLCLVGIRARRSGDLSVIGEFARTLSYVGLRVFAPAVVVVLASGVWLVLARSRWDFTQLWILLALGTFAAAFLIGAVYLSRSAIQLERFATQTMDLQAAREALRRWIVGYGIVLALLAFAVWDMVFKPGT